MSKKVDESGEGAHALMSYRRGALPSGRSRVAPRFKVYANPAEVAALPAPKLEGGLGTWTTLRRERGGSPEGGRLKQAQLSQLLWAGLGFTSAQERTHLVSQEVSSLEGYVFAFDVQDLFAGTYHYNPREHTLSQLKMAEQRDEMAASLVTPTEIGAIALVVCLTGLPNRHRPAHGPRCYRYALMDAGAAAQNLTLAAVSLGLAATVITDFYDDEVTELLGIKGRAEWPLTLIAVGV